MRFKYPILHVVMSVAGMVCCHAVAGAQAGLSDAPQYVVSDRLEYSPLSLYPGECSVKAVTRQVVSDDGFTMSSVVDPGGGVSILRTVEYYGESYRVTEVSWGGFESCHLDSLRIPGSVTAVGNLAFADAVADITVSGSVDVIGHYAFAGLTGSVNLLEGVRYIYDNAFGGFVPGNSDESSRTLVLPSTIETLGRTILGVSLGGDRDAGFDLLQCHALTPPEVEEDADGDVNLCSKPESYSRIKLFVPDEVVDLYRSAPGWEKFTSIHPLSESGIDSVIAQAEISIEAGDRRCLIISDDPRDIPVKIYTADGHQIYFGHEREIALAPGLYIVRAATTSAKIVIR